MGSPSVSASLRMAAWLGNLKDVKHCLAGGARVDEAGDNGTTALHAAAQRGHVEVVDELLHARASIDAIDQALQTPLMLALEARLETLTMVKLLLVRGADARRRNLAGRTAYTIAYDQADPLSLVAFESVGREQSLSQSLAALDEATTKSGLAAMQEEVRRELQDRAAVRECDEAERIGQTTARDAQSEREYISATTRKVTALHDAIAADDFDEAARVLEERRQQLLAEGRQYQERLLSEPIRRWTEADEGDEDDH